MTRVGIRNADNRRTNVALRLSAASDEALNNFLSDVQSHAACYSYQKPREREHGAPEPTVPRPFGYGPRSGDASWAGDGITPSRALRDRTAKHAIPRNTDVT